MANEKYVERIKSASTGVIYTIRDQDTASKQDILISGENIKTINDQSILGSGNIQISGTGAVDSVNGKTGTVVLNASDVHAATEAQGALADTAVQPSAISDMETKTHASSTYQAKLTSANAGTNVTITEESGVVKINAAGGSGGASTFAELQGQPTDNANLAAALNDKQDTLVSGTNIKSINSTSLLGSGNIEVLTSSDVGTMAAENKADYYTKTEVTDDFLSSNQGSENSGKILNIDSEGEIVNTSITDLNLATKTELSTKQDTLVSGTNIKTINNLSILGEGNISIGGSGGTSDYNQLDNRPSIEGVTLTGNKTAAELNLRALVGPVVTEYYEDHGTLPGYRAICPSGQPPAEGSTVPGVTGSAGSAYRTTPELVLAPGESIELYTTAATVGRAWGRYKESDRTVIDYAEGNANYLTTPWTWTNTYDYNIIVVCCFDSTKVSGDMSKFQVTVTHLESTTPTINNVAVEGHLSGADLHLAADNYGSANAGKALYVDSDGSIIPQTVSIPSQQIDDAVEDYLDSNPDIPKTVIYTTTTYTSPAESSTVDGIQFNLEKYYGIYASSQSKWTDPAPTGVSSLSGCLAVKLYLNEGDSIDAAYIKGGSNARAFAVYDPDNNNALMYDDQGNVIGAGSGGGTGINDYSSTPWSYTAPKRVMILMHGYGMSGGYASKFSITITRRVDNDPKINNVPMKFGQNVTGADLGLVDKSYVDGRLNDIYTEAIFPATASDNPPLDTGSYFTEYYINAASTSIGSVFSAPKQHLAGFWCFQDIYLKKGDKVTLYNKGGSNGRGWWYCDAKDHRLLARAESGENHLTTPLVFTADRDLWFGGTCSTKSLNLTIERAVSKDSERIVQLQVQADSNTERLDAIDGGGVGPTNYVSKINNPKMDWNKQQIRILDIGNSFSQNAYNYIESVIDNLQVDTSNMAFCMAVMGGSSYKDWYDCYTDQKDKSYSISQRFGGLTETFNGTAANLNGEKFRRALSEHDWDLILIHQVSTYSNDYKLWEGHASSGYLKELVRLIRYHCPRASLGFLMVHAGPSNNPNTTERWGQIAESAAWMKMQYGVDIVVPVGTAVQGIRQSVVAANAAHQMTADNSHQASGLSKYTSTLTSYEALFAPIFHKSCWECTYYPEAGTAPTGYESDYIDVTAENAILAKKAAITAVSDMFTLNNPDDIIFPYVEPESGE